MARAKEKGPLFNYHRVALVRIRTEIVRRCRSHYDQIVLDREFRCLPTIQFSPFMLGLLVSILPFRPNVDGRLKLLSLALLSSVTFVLPFRGSVRPLFLLSVALLFCVFSHRRLSPRGHS